MTVDDGSPLVIGVDLGGTKCHGAVASLDGVLLAEDLRPTDPTRAYETVIDCVDVLRHHTAAAGRRIGAVALGAPGVVDPHGRVVHGPNVGWHDVDVRDRLARDLGLPVVVDNDADLAAMGEARRGAARGVADFVLVAIGTGIGGAVVVGGQVVKGSHGAAGEIGAMVLARHDLDERGRGDLGWLERAAAGPGLTARAAELLAGQNGYELPSCLHPVRLSPAAVLDAARGGDRLARAVVDEALDHLAMAIVAVACALDPALVILDGGVGRALGPDLHELARRVAPHTPVMPALCVSTLRPTATLVGAVLAAVDAAGAGAGIGVRTAR